MFFCSACFNKVSSFFLINLNSISAFYCTKGLPSLCENGPQLLPNADLSLYVYTST